MATGLLSVDKPYGVTEGGKLVKPNHPLCRQILAHKNGQEVPAPLLQRAGLTNADGTEFVAKEYDEVEIPDEYKPKSAQDSAATPGGITLTEDQLTKLLQDAAAAGAAAALAAKTK